MFDLPLQVHATIPEQIFTEREAARGDKYACNPHTHTIIQSVQAQQKYVHRLWHAL